MSTTLHQPGNLNPSTSTNRERARGDARHSKFNRERVDPLNALLDLVRNAAREGAEEALAVQVADSTATVTPLLDKRDLAHALAVSPATIDRMCRDGRIPFVRVGDVRRFDLAAVRKAIQSTEQSAPAPQTTRKSTRVAGVRLLTRKTKRPKGLERT